MVAFHEAFADIVAIFQHFTLPGLLLDQIQRTRGNLRSNGLLAQLAAQFARATGQGDALRNALGDVRQRGRAPAPGPVRARAGPSSRTSAARSSWPRCSMPSSGCTRAAIADLRRIATGGTGVLPDGDIHPDLARRFAEEAVGCRSACSTCAFARSTTCRPSTSPSATFSARSSPPTPTSSRTIRRRYRLAFIEAFRDRGHLSARRSRPRRGRAALEVRSIPRPWRCIESVLPPAAVLRTMVAAYESTRDDRPSSGKRGEYVGFVETLQGWAISARPQNCSSRPRASGSARRWRLDVRAHDVGTWASVIRAT